MNKTITVFLNLDRLEFPKMSNDSKDMEYILELIKTFKGVSYSSNGRYLIVYSEKVVLYNILFQLLDKFNIEMY